MKPPVARGPARPEPAHFDLTPAQWFWSALAIAAAAILLAAAVGRVLTRIDLLQWWVPAAVLAGIVAADLGSGLVHWVADTWGRDDLPLIGPRLLVPFRVHHVNPDDLARRDFVDTNGEVAGVAVLVLGVLLALPIERAWGAVLAVFGVAFCGAGMLTNQIHQWAHVPSPPAPVRMLQQAGLILSPAAHAVHHARPYDVSYCIATGWCNRPLEAIAFFRRSERALTSLTGAQPRADDGRYGLRHHATDGGV